MSTKYPIIQSWKFSGIYKITNLYTGKFYVGSSVNVRNRIQLHLGNLKKNKHHNIHLQNSFNLHGEEVFIFELLAKCPKEYCVKLEQWFLDNLKPEYNICKIAGSTLGVPMKQHVKEILLKYKKEHRRSPEEQRLRDKELRKLKNLNKQPSPKKPRKHRESISFYNCKNLEKRLKDIKERLQDKTYEEIYGKEKALEIKNKISKAIKNSQAHKESCKNKKKGYKQTKEWIEKRTKVRFKKVQVEDVLTKEIVLFNSVKDAALFYKVTSPCIITAIKNNKKFYKKSKIAKYV